MNVDENKQADSKFTLIGWDVSIRGVIALLLVITVCVMNIMSIKVEEPLYSAVLMALGLYFGKQTQNKNEK